MIKTTLITAVLASTLWLAGCNDVDSPVDQSADQAAIKEVLRAETQAYLDKDYDAWASYWLHSEDVLRVGVGYGAKSEVHGWQRVDGMMRTIFENQPEVETGEFEKTNFIFHIDQQVAWASYDEVWSEAGVVLRRAKGQTTFVKEDGDWKLVAMTAINSSSFENHPRPE